MADHRRSILVFSGVILVALAWFWSTPSKIEHAAPTPVSLPPKPIVVLVANRQLSPGLTLSEDMVEWSAVHEKELPQGALWREDGTTSVNPYLGRILIRSVMKAVPLMPQDFADLENGNFVATQLQPGKRAYAIAIDTKGTATAGNFILPNDHVDIIHSFNSNMGLQSETLITNIRVLAVGQNIHGEGLSSVGDTATVEVDLREAELLATAQRTGQISLALRNPSEAVLAPQKQIHLLIIRPTISSEKSP